MESGSVSDLTKDIVFKKEEWMGKKYPKDAPIELDDFRDATLKIPPAIRKSLLPNPEMTVQAFISLSLPPCTVSLIDISAATCFIEKEPMQNFECLRTRKLPSKEFVATAKACLGQALLDGAQSIKDPSYKGESLPLWAIQYWLEMYEATKGQAEWIKSVA